MVFKNHYNSRPVADEVNNKPSKTIPNQSMSVREIMHRFANGLPITGQKVPVYEPEDLDGLVPPNWNTLDISEKHDYLAYQKAHVNDLTVKLQKESHQLRQAEIEKIRKEEREKIEKELNPKTSTPPFPVDKP